MAIDSGSTEVDVLTNEEIRAHMQRVELLCGLVESMMKAMVDTPFGAMLPPDLVRTARGL